MKWHSKNHAGRRALFVAVLVGGLIALTACSSGAASSTGNRATSSGGSGATQSLTVGIPAISTVFTDVYWGVQKGYFKKAGLNLVVQNVGTNGPNLLAAGRIDMFANGLGTPLSISAQGKQTTVVFATLGAGDSGAITVMKSSGINNIMQLSGKRVAVQGVGGSSYGWGQIYSNYVVQQGGKKFNLVPVNTVPQIVQGLTAGQYSAAVITGGFFAQQVQNGTAKYLVNPSTPEGSKYISFAGGPYPEAGWFGLASALPKKKEAITRFLAALGAADAAVHNATPAQIGAVLHGNPDWAPTPASTIALDVQYDLSFMDPQKGEITETAWSSLLKHLPFWQISGLDLNSPQVSYAKAVDMSYLKAANGLKINFSG